MTKYKLAIFDLDGTLLNTLDDLCDATNYTLKEMNCPLRTLDEVRQFVGNGIPALLKRALPENSTTLDQDKAFSIFMPYYKQHSMDKTRPYDGITELLSTLHRAGILTAVASNKRDEAVKSLCSTCFPGLFDMTIGDREGAPKKPDPAMVNCLLSGLNIDKSDAIYIGDSDVDLLTAKNSDLDYVLVTWGFRDEAFLRNKGGEHFAHNTKELAEYLM